MVFKEIIKKKRDGLELSENEIRQSINGYLSGEIPDYQFAAFLMAIFFRGMSYKETLAITDAMLRSGKFVDVKVEGTIVDKHSTGGIGDKVSLVLAPVLAEMGFKAPLLAGRALGFTGGTIDKLESTGMRTELSPEEITEVVSKFGFSISAQTEDIAPADRKIYALRDATSTVESIPLIVSSILSKKLAINTEAIVFDVKVGSGAFMKKFEEAKQLAEGLVNVSKLYGKKSSALITDMNQPLGRSAGNLIEVFETLDALSGNISNDLLEVVSSLAGAICELTGVSSFIEGKVQARDVILSGTAVSSFTSWIEHLGGSLDVKLASNRRYVESKKSGYVSYIDGENLGYLIVEMGGGRKKAGEKVDYSVGLRFFKKIGDYVEKGEPIGEVIFNMGDGERFVAKFLDSFEISSEPVSCLTLVKEVVR